MTDDRNLNSADPRDPAIDTLAAERKAQKLDADRERRRTMLMVFSTAEGLKVLEHLRERLVKPGGFDATDPRRGPDYAVYRDGQRDLVHYIDKELQIARTDREV